MKPGTNLNYLLSTFQKLRHSARAINEWKLNSRGIENIREEIEGIIWN